MRFLITWAATLALAIPAHAQRSAFVLIGPTGDTVAIERFSRSPDSVAAELLVQVAGARFTFTAALGPDATVSRLVNEFRAASAPRDTTPAQRAIITFRGDSAIAEITTGTNTVVQRLGTQAGAVPFINPSFVLVEQIVRRARQMGGDSADVPVFVVQGGATMPFQIRALPGDSVLASLGGAPARLAVDADGAIMGGVVPSQGLRIIRVESMPEGAMRVEPRSYAAPPGAPYTAQEVRIPTPNGYELAGTLTVPREAPRPVPAFVTITGSGLQERDESLPMVPGYALFRQVADTLGRHGVAVLRMDDRGTGASGGDASRATTADFADDVRAGLARLRAHPDIDGDRLGLIGHSEGGLIALMIAARDSSLVGVVLMGTPAWTGRRVIESQNRYLVEQSPELTAAQRDSLVQASMRMVDSAATPLPWLRFALDYDPLVDARRVSVPVLILQGGTDRQVTAEQAPELAAALRAGGNADVTMRIFDDTNHLFLPDTSGHWAQYGRLRERAVRPAVLGTLLTWVTARAR
ncbi:MAG TPA: alpha/beta fold hydrolase [Gemmatimonadaceae bacterium]